MPDLDPVYEAHARLIATRVAEILREHEVVVPEYVSPRDAATLLGISERALENYRVRDAGGPPFHRVGRIVRYRVADLHGWMAERRMESV